MLGKIEGGKRRGQQRVKGLDGVTDSMDITLWQIEGMKVETLTDFIFLSNTMDGDCCHKIERCFLLGRKAMTNLDGVLKSRDVTLPTKVCIVKAMVSPVIMYCTDVRVGPQRRLSSHELMLLNCGDGEVFRVPRTAGDQTSQS